MAKRILVVLGLLLALFLGVLYVLGLGVFVEPPLAGEAAARAVASEVIAERSRHQQKSAREIGVARPKQILFGDLHVHTTFSFDAFQMSLPMAGGDGAHPVADACDYARHCAGLDFWSINDHGITLTPRRWAETVDSIRQCNAVAGDTSNPDLVTYLGWEWTQVGTTPENHWGHKNVIVRDLDDGRIPTRPITAGTPPGLPSVQEGAPSPFALGLVALLAPDTGGTEFARYMTETMSIPDCPSGVPVRDLPVDCREVAPTPGELFAKLDDWGFESMVIPHGTTWGYYTSLGSSWDKQLTPEQHDPARQSLVEVFSGHGNSEEFRSFREVVLHADGTRSCPKPNENYLPSCWRAGEIIEARCLADAVRAEECSERAGTARQNFVDADFNGGSATVGASEVAEWQDAGQCRDCFQPAFNYRPRSSVQYMLGLGRPGPSPEDPAQRFRFGFIASSDNHSARPGTGYKEVARTEFTETRFGNFPDTPLGAGADTVQRSESRRVEVSEILAPFLVFETERQASFFLNGGLAAVHSTGRDRAAIWDAMQRKEVYGTSGPRMLLWFDLLNAPGGHPAPMGSEVALGDTPIFQVRAVGSFEQKPGCPPDALGAMAPERIERLCQGECYHPSDRRRPISRIEVIRIRPQQDAGESISTLVEDPWRVLHCSGDPSGCQVAFSDDEYRDSGRDTVYYVRAIEAPSPAVGADPLGCRYDEAGRCIEVNPCFGRPADDECLAETEERAWSSPIFVDHAGG
ncbi:MAG: DUF3604 domain-containing protein [Deltaproteobacteria bacterium]|nr:DUF3604 domain-containing protein [Deltaproteobacteria bacterium]